MRMALAVVVVVAACGDDGGHTTGKDAAVDTKMIDAPMPDADLGVTGSWIDRYVSDSGTTTLANCLVAPTGMTIDPVSAVTNPYSGACKADGSFRIIPPPPGIYYLKLATSFYETSKRSGLDFSTGHLGRSDVAPITGVTLSLAMTGMSAWDAGDNIVAFSSNIGYSQVATFTTGTPNNNDTTLTATVPWNGYKVDSAKSDTLQLIQLGTHTTGGGLAYTTLDRAYTAPALTMTNNTPTTINGAFTTPTASTLNLRIDTASFTQFANATNPNVMTKTMDGTLAAAVSGDAKASPALVSFGMAINGIASLNFGTLSYGDPFPSAWSRMLRIQAVFQVPYTYAGVTSPRSATLTRVVSRASADGNIVDSAIGPPTNVKFDNDDAFTATTISTVPKLSWSPPTFGTPTDYEIQVYEVTLNGSSLKFTSILKLTTKQTLVRIPTGMLLGQRQYVFSVIARMRTNIDIYATPLQVGDTSASAEMLSALVTTGA